MSRPKASFVVPVYNGELYVAEAIDSCLLQTEANVEVVVVDDGSTDGTKEVLEWIKDHSNGKVKVITLEKNIGRSNARNMGIEAAVAPFVFMMDADDISHRDRVKNTLAHIKKHPQASLFFGDFDLVDEVSYPFVKVDCGPILKDNVEKNRTFGICHSTLAFRKGLCLRVQYTEDDDHSKMAIDDWKFYVDCAKAGMVFHYIPKVLASYRSNQRKRDEEKILEIKKKDLEGFVLCEENQG